MHTQPIGICMKTVINFWDFLSLIEWAVSFNIYLSRPNPCPRHCPLLVTYSWYIFVLSCVLFRASSVDPLTFIHWAMCFVLISSHNIATKSHHPQTLSITLLERLKAVVWSLFWGKIKSWQIPCLCKCCRTFCLQHRTNLSLRQWSICCWKPTENRMACH